MFEIENQLYSEINNESFANISNYIYTQGSCPVTGCYGCSDECVSSCDGGCEGSCEGHGCKNTCYGNTR